MKFIKISLLAVALTLAFSACGKKAKNQITLEEAKGPGRDAELYRDAVNSIRRGNYDAGRIIINTMVNTYPDSPLVKIAKLSNADSFYLQGGTKNLAQAGAGYREFIEFFPDDPLADEAMIKIAEIHLRQVQAHNRDITHALLAERQLKETLRRFPNTDQRDMIATRMQEVQEILALHELEVAKFNLERRQATMGAQTRLEEILNKYPNFSRFDEALWLHAQTLTIQEDTETASRDLTRLITTYPNSEYAAKAKEMLERFGKPVPEADPAKLENGKSEEGKGLVSRATGFLFGPKIDTSNKGVVIDRDLTTDEIVARAQELGGVARPVGPTAPGAVTTTTTGDGRPRRVGEGTAGQDVEVKAGAPAATGNAKEAATKKDDKKKKDDEKKKKEEEEKKKKNGSTPLLRNP